MAYAGPPNIEIPIYWNGLQRVETYELWSITSNIVRITEHH